MVILHIPIKSGLKKFFKLQAIVFAWMIASCEGSLNTGKTVGEFTTNPTDHLRENGEKPPEHLHVLAKYGGVYKDEQVESTIARIVGRLIANTDDPSQIYRITILNSPNVNAFALPGGYLYITRGLLALANDSSEVAAVLAHEIGHITSGHSFARIRKVEDADFAKRVISRVIENPTAAEIATKRNRLSLAQFSRAQELHADIIGIRTVAQAGYDPYSTARFLELREKYSGFLTAGRANSDQVDYLASHPATPDRVQRAKHLARQYGLPGLGEQGQQEYLEGIDGILFGEDPQGGFVRGNVFYEKNLKIAFEIPAGFKLEDSSQVLLFSNSEGIAFRFDEIELGRDESLSGYIRSGWINGLEEYSVRPKTVGGLPANTASATIEGRAFRIAVIRAGGHGYRFIATTRDADESFERSFLTAVGSFKQLSNYDLSRLKPLKIEVIEAEEGDTSITMARKMVGIQPSKRLEMFKYLNGIQQDTEFKQGMPFKVVVN